VGEAVRDLVGLRDRDLGEAFVAVRAGPAGERDAIRVAPGDSALVRLRGATGWRSRTAASSIQCISFG
jgi:hypothetical protein